ncbi:hypothetical protein J6590_082470 [Homalodisca vitripennis]|nr:hypothetical protein J6590_082467 [Homalodisca vitripennis]KAG8246543.1 hypothetical protein J6590_082470 [Homalodisca vitripennis]
MARTHDHPDAIQFLYRMRWFIMGKHSTTVMSVKHNTESDNEECLASSDITTHATDEECASAKQRAPLIQQRNDEEKEGSWDLYVTHQVESESAIQLDEDTDKMKIESLRYVTGYVTIKLQKKYPAIGTKGTCASQVT